MRIFQNGADFDLVQYLQNIIFCIVNLLASSSVVTKAGDNINYLL